MTRARTPLETAAGQLVSAIQREWSAEAGGPCSDLTEEVIRSSHQLLKAARTGSLAGVVGQRSVSEFLGRRWVNAHPWVWPHVQVLEALALGEADA